MGDPHRPAPSPGQRRPGWKVKLCRGAVKLLGWQLRGQLPPQFWRTTLVMWAPKTWQGRALAAMMPVKVRWIQAPVSDVKGRGQESLRHFEQGMTNATVTQATEDELRAIVHAAQQAKSRITLCAWEERRKFVHVHAPFKTSPFPDRDVHYMHRYFAYFAKTAGAQHTA